MKPNTKLQKYLCSLWQELLKIEVVGINDDFFSCGGDSLLAMQMQIQLLQEGYNITYSAIFKHTTVAMLSQFIEENKNKEVIDIDSMDDNELKKINNKYAEILRKTMVLPKEYSDEELGGVLLTGATGYLGIHILQELIENTDSIIYCIVREKQNELPEERIINLFKHYFNGKYTDLINKRIILVKGDLSKHKFGLEEEIYEKLSEDVNSIINCSANVKHYGMEEEFKSDNVISVKNLLNFCKESGKKMYHMSTVGVSAHINEPYAETVDFEEGNLYIRTKLRKYLCKDKIRSRIISSRCYIARNGCLYF